MNSFRFENPDFLYFLVLIPVLFLIVLASRVSAKKRLRTWLGAGNHQSTLLAGASKARPWMKSALLLLSLTLLIFAIARPQFGSKLMETKRQGIELIIALDVSNSMLAEDIQPNRLANAKRAISRLVDNLENDKIGLIVFAGDAYVQLPITTDFGAAKLFLSSVNTEIVPRQGTSIGAAIELASKSFSPEAENSKAIIVLTDGENHEEGALDAAKVAVEKGITIHTIGMGLPQGAPIPVLNQYGQKDFRKDHEGKVVVSKLDEGMLQEIALAGNGIYLRANNSRTGLATLFSEINKMDKQELESKVYAEYEEQFQYPLGAALLILLLEVFILARKNRLFSLIKIEDRT